MDSPHKGQVMWKEFTHLWWTMQPKNHVHCLTFVVFCYGTVQVDITHILQGCISDTGPMWLSRVCVATLLCFIVFCYGLTQVDITHIFQGYISWHWANGIAQSLCGNTAVFYCVLLWFNTGWYYPYLSGLYLLTLGPWDCPEPVWQHCCVLLCFVMV